MKRWWPRKIKSILGVDIADHAIHIVELAHTNDDYQLLSVASTPIIINDTLTLDEAQLIALKTAVASTQCRRAVAALAFKDVMVKELVIETALNERQLTQYVYQQAAQFANFPLAELCVDYTISDNAKTGLKVQVVVAKRQQVEAYYRLFSLAGLKLTALRIDIYALQKLISFLSQHQAAAFINVSDNNLQMVNTNNFIYEQRSMPATLAVRVEDILAHYQTHCAEKMHETIWLSGKYATNVMEVINHYAHIQAKIFNIFDYFKQPQLNNGLLDGHGFAVSCGLAM